MFVRFTFFWFHLRLFASLPILTLMHHALHVMDAPAIIQLFTRTRLDDTKLMP